ncbi:MAG: phosphatase PAP2 family protein [Planctomycetota bacterium]
MLLLVSWTCGCSAPDTPHSSLGNYVDSHFSSHTWLHDTWPSYLESSNWILPASLAVSALAVRPFDKDLQESFDGQWGDRPEIGDAATGVLLLGMLGSTFLAPRDHSAVDQFWNSAESFALAYGTASLTNVFVRRTRPIGNDHASFPSGHTAGAFTAATLIERNLGIAYGIPAYGLATVTAFSRVEVGKHFPSDVLAGAAIGVLAVHLVDTLHFGTDSSAGICGTMSSVQLIPGFDDDGVSLSLAIPF